MFRHDEDINEHFNFSCDCLTETKLSVMQALLTMMSMAYAEWMRILFSLNKGTLSDKTEVGGLHIFSKCLLCNAAYVTDLDVHLLQIQVRCFKANRDMDSIKVNNQKLFFLLFRWILKTSNTIWSENCRVYEFCILWHRDLLVSLYYQMDKLLRTHGVIRKTTF
jgi:hypothetical protein